MKKKLFYGIVLALSLCLLLVGCSGRTNFGKMVKFDKTEIDKIVIHNGNAYKEFTDREIIDKLYDDLKDLEFVKNKSEKFESDWAVDVTFAVDFYIKGESGYISLIVGKGLKASEEFKDNGYKTGFYDAKDNTYLIKIISDIYFK